MSPSKPPLMQAYRTQSPSPAPASHHFQTARQEAGHNIICGSDVLLGLIRVHRTWSLQLPSREALWASPTFKKGPCWKVTENAIQDARSHLRVRRMHQTQQSTTLTPPTAGGYHVGQVNDKGDMACMGRMRAERLTGQRLSSQPDVRIYEFMISSSSAKLLCLSRSGKLDCTVQGKCASQRFSPLRP